MVTKAIAKINQDRNLCYFEGELISQTETRRGGGGEGGSRVSRNSVGDFQYLGHIWLKKRSQRKSLKAADGVG